MKFNFTHHRPSLSFVILQAKEKGQIILRTLILSRKRISVAYKGLTFVDTDKSKKKHKDRERVHGETGGDVADRKKPPYCESFFSTHRLIPAVRQLTK